MKVKIKISVEEFKYLLQFVGRSLNRFINELSELQILNLSEFIRVNSKKLIDYHSLLQIAPNKARTISIEVNQYYEVLKLFKKQEENLDSYLFNLWVTMTNQSSKQNFVSLNLNS